LVEVPTTLFCMEYPYVATDTDLGDGDGDTEPGTPIAGTPTLRPCLTIELKGPTGQKLDLPIPALLDSGADSSVFPIELAELLGVSLPKCRKEAFDSADGDGTEFVWDEPLTATFDGQTVKLTAAFADTPIALLGRDDFFVHYLVTINQRDRNFILQAQPGKGEET